MTDREKRAALDAELRNKHPNATDEQIRAMREEYVTAHYGKLLPSSLLQPEYRQPWTRPLTLETLKEQLSYEGNQNIGFSILGIVMCLFLAALLIMPSIVYGRIVWIFLWLAIIPAVIGIVLLFRLLRIWKDKKSAAIQLQNGSFRIDCHLVMDMECEDLSGPGDDTADVHFYLYLDRDNKPWRYECSKQIYEQLREGDTAYFVYRYGSIAPCFIFRKENWVPDQDILARMPEPAKARDI